MTRHLTLERLEAREVPAAKLQFIHNSPFAGAETVDVYVNNVLLLNDFPFRSASPFLDLASQTNLKIDIADAAATNNTNPLATQTLNLPDNSATVAVAIGKPGSTGAAALRLATASARTTAQNPGQVDLLAFNGSPNAPFIDLRVRGVGRIGENLAPGTFSAGYSATTATKHIAVATPGLIGLPLAAARLELSNHAGETAVLMASGFARPASPDDPKLALVAVFADGTSVTFAPYIQPAFAVSTVTVNGSEVMLADTDGNAAIAIIAFPGATGAARVAAADLTGDGVPDIIAGSGPGIYGTVRILDGATGELIHEIEPFGPFIGGINVCAGDLTGDGVPDYVLSPDDGGGPRVRVFDGATHQQIADYFGIDDVNFRGGARATIGDLNGDGRGDLIVSAGLGGGPRVALFDGMHLGMNGGPKFAGDFFAFEAELRNGAFLACGDVDGDGADDLIVGGGPGGGPRVRVLDGRALTSATLHLNVLADFFAGDANDRLGSRIAARDLDGDGRADIVAGGVPGGVAVRVFLAADLPLTGFGTPAANATFNDQSFFSEVFVG